MMKDLGKIIAKLLDQKALVSPIATRKLGV